VQFNYKNLNSKIMQEENVLVSSITDDNQGSKENKKRVSYVARDLSSMIDFVAKVYNQLGHTAHHSNKAIAAVHSLSADSIKQQLTAAQQYKLFELKHGVGYKITEHFQKLYLPRNEAEKRSAVIESLKNVETYQQLFKDYEYHVVPSDGVRNHFIRSYGYKDDVAAKATQVFIDNLKEYELLDSRGVLVSALPSKPIIPEVSNAEENSTVSNTNAENENKVDSNQLPAERNAFNKVVFHSEMDTAGTKSVPIHLIGDKKALLVYPDEITEDDIEIVRHQIDGILLRIKLESKSRAKAEN
jgi:hypothetical protein